MQRCILSQLVFFLTSHAERAETQPKVGIALSAKIVMRVGRSRLGANGLHLYMQETSDAPPTPTPPSQN